MPWGPKVAGLEGVGLEGQATWFMEGRGGSFTCWALLILGTIWLDFIGTDAIWLDKAVGLA